MSLDVTRWDKPSEHPNKVFIEKDLKAWGYRTELWVDKPGTHYKDYVHDVDEIVWILRGDARVDVGEESVTLSSGDRVLVPKNTRHSLEVLGSQTLYWLAAFKKPEKPSASRKPS
jgi:mannose-6-phosphate isomerase-like protein (cupin superfamily)